MEENGDPGDPSLNKVVETVGLDPKNIPVHVACVMDGNGRWAKQKGKLRIVGHKHGVDAIRKVLRGAKELGVKYLSVYAFSTENWSRPEAEVTFLMKLFEELIEKEARAMHKEGVRVRFGGQFKKLKKLREKIKYAENLTQNNTTIQFNIMLNYGGRQEIVDGVNTWLESRGEGEPFTEELMRNHLYIPESPDPDLWIRSSGESRLSNFLLWQSAYAELVFEETLWPDFNKDTLVKCIQSYQERDRRFGGL